MVTGEKVTWENLLEAVDGPIMGNYQIGDNIHINTNTFNRTTALMILISELVTPVPGERIVSVQSHALGLDKGSFCFASTGHCMTLAVEALKYLILPD